MTSENIYATSNMLLDKMEELSAEHTCIKDINIKYDGFGIYIIEIQAKESEFIMDSLLSKSLTSELKSENFNFGDLIFTKVQINLIK